MARHDNDEKRAIGASAPYRDAPFAIHGKIFIRAVVLIPRYGGVLTI
jgi:hypothetical protein